MRQWYKMKKAADSKSAEILIYDEIGFSFWGESITAKQFVRDLADLGDVDTITVRINSPGGDVFDGVAIYNALRNHDARIVVQIDGIAASIASLIAMAGNEINMPANAFMLIHNAWGLAMGNAEDMRKIAAELDVVDQSIVATYVSRTKGSARKIRDIMAEDRLMDADEAKSLGLIDNIIDGVKLAANFTMSKRLGFEGTQAAIEKFKASAENGDGSQGGPPPPSEPEPEGADPLPVVDPPPTDISDEGSQVDPTPPSNVVNLRKEPIMAEADTKKFIKEVSDLCVLAGKPDLISGYINADKPKSIDEIRAELIDARAKDAAVLVEVIGQHPLAEKAKSATDEKAAADAWQRSVDKRNARFKQ